MSHFLSNSLRPGSKAGWMKSAATALLATVLAVSPLAGATEAGPRDRDGRWQHTHRADDHRREDHRRDHRADHRPRHPHGGPPGLQRAPGKGHAHHPGQRHEARSHAPVRHAYPRDAFHRLSRAERYELQRRLARQGYYRGPIDGLWGPGTLNGMNAWAGQNSGYQMSSLETTMLLLQALLR